ncbi:hypothetical protein YQE_01555, partial [Dendroctonus ponderosae]
MKRAILGYNNSIHSITKFTPYEVTTGHIKCINPFELNYNAITSSYIQTHKETSNKLYQKNNEEPDADIAIPSRSYPASD